MAQTSFAMVMLAIAASGALVLSSDRRRRAIALGAVTLLATYLPARRASLVEPIIALRSEP